MEWFGCMPGRGDRMEPSDRHTERQSWDEAFRRLYAPLVYRLGSLRTFLDGGRWQRRGRTGAQVRPNVANGSPYP